MWFLESIAGIKQILNIVYAGDIRSVWVRRVEKKAPLGSVLSSPNLIGDPCMRYSRFHGNDEQNMHSMRVYFLEPL